MTTNHETTGQNQRKTAGCKRGRLALDGSTKVALLAARESKPCRSHCRQRCIFRQQNPDKASFSTHEFASLDLPRQQSFPDNFSATTSKNRGGRCFRYAPEVRIRGSASMPSNSLLHRRANSAQEAVDCIPPRFKSTVWIVQTRHHRFLRSPSSISV